MMKTSSVAAMLGSTSLMMMKGVNAQEAWSKTGGWAFSPAKEIVSEQAGVGKLKLTYQTYLNTEFDPPRGYIKGKFDLEDKRVGGVWPRDTVKGEELKICMHLGTPWGQQDYLENLKWEIHPYDKVGWKPVVYSPHYNEWQGILSQLKTAAVISDEKDPKLYCGFPDVSPYINNEKNPGDNGILVEGGTYDPVARKASVSWMREFEVPDTTDTVTLVAD